MRDIVVVGGSAGAVHALKTLVAGLPADFPGSVFVVLHTAPEGPGLLPAILSRSGPLPAAHPADGEAVLPGRIYVAPPDRHLVLRGGHVHLSRGPRENATRPAVNVLFRSAARSYGARVVGVVLTGTLDNGAAGLVAIDAAGGTSVVQEPADADYPDMPRHALEVVDAEHVLPLARIPACLVELVTAPAPQRPETKQMPSDDETPAPPPVNQASGWSCPECHGSLWEIGAGPATEYRCRIGHRYSPDTLLHELGEKSSDELESARRALEEEAAMAELMVERAVGRELPRHRVDRYRARAAVARERAAAVGRAVAAEPQG